MRAKMGTMRRRAITVSATEDVLELHVDSVLELLRFTGIAIAAIRMGVGADGSGHDHQDEKETDQGYQGPEGRVDGAVQQGSQTDDRDDGGFERDIFLSYRSIRIQVA